MPDAVLAERRNCKGIQIPSDVNHLKRFFNGLLYSRLIAEKQARISS